MAHELGHVLGLYHVSDPAAIMYRASGSDRGYTQQIVDHAQLLYELGPGLPYPGFGPPIPGTTPEEWMGSVDEVTFDASRGVVTGRAWHNGGGHNLESERLRVVALFLDAEGDVVGDERVEFRERSGANTPWSFELPAPEEWDAVALVTVGQIEARELFGMDCTDADNRGQSGTVRDENSRRIRACVYQRSDIEVAGDAWNPRTAAKDLADRALEDLQSQEDEGSSADGADQEPSIGEIAPGLDALDAEPVPAIPVGGLGLLAGWLLLMGCRRQRSESTRRNRYSAG